LKVRSCWKRSTLSLSATAIGLWAVVQTNDVQGMYELEQSHQSHELELKKICSIELFAETQPEQMPSQLGGSQPVLVNNNRAKLENALGLSTSLGVNT
jgi:hypothetical protein